MMNDDDESTFRPLAAATTKILSKIEQFKEIGRQSNEPQDQEDPCGDHQKAKRAEGDKRRYVDSRLRELAAFERRARGKGFKR